MVITIIAILSVSASSLFLNTDRYSTIAAREQLLLAANLAQKRALTSSMTASPVILTIKQTTSDWFYVITRGTMEFDQQVVTRSGANLSVNGTTLNNNEGFSISFDGNAETSLQTQFVFSAGNIHALCISATGFAYIGTCQP